MVITESRAVSVVMPVYNALPYLDTAVESILGQSFGDFEFVILDDASTDGSTERLREWAARDARIKLIEERKNLGPALSSQKVASLARGSIVARMDADDVSLPGRLADQLEVLSRHPDVGVVGGLYDMIGPDGQVIRGPDMWRLLAPKSVPPFGNGPLTYRRRFFDQVGGYRRQCEFWEDNDLILRMAEVTKIMVVPYSVYQVRLAKVSNRLSADQVRVERAVDLMYRARAEVAQGRPYEHLLGSALPGDRKVNPQVFVSLGSIVLWSGGRPRLFRRLLRRGALRFDRETITALIWTAWAAVEPRSLRLFIRMLLLARTFRSRLVLRPKESVLWPMGTHAAPNVESGQRFTTLSTSDTLKPAQRSLTLPVSDRSPSRRT